MNFKAFNVKRGAKFTSKLSALVDKVSDFSTMKPLIKDTL